jgi:H+/gluconate symporter-like permease
MSILILVLSILLLLILITFGKLNAFLSLIFSAILVGIAKQMPLADILPLSKKELEARLAHSF